jgi:prepilin-type N-terminal cleavage/methylation domain-containing protein
MIYKLKNKNRGFTLVEMLVAVGLFALIAVFALGSVVTIFDANKKAQASKTVVDNLNLSIENMVRTIRFGDHYFCGLTTESDAVMDCDYPTGGNSISVTFKGVRTLYSLWGNQIKKSDTGALSCSDPSMQAITSTDTVIDYFKFYVFNTASSDSSQSYVRVVIKGHVGAKSTTKTDFSIETLISQIVLDYP